MTYFQNQNGPRIILLTLSTLVVSTLLIGIRVKQKEHSLKSIRFRPPSASVSINKKNAPAKIASLSQAETFYRMIKTGLEQPNQFPFHPQWSDERFDPNTAEDPVILDKLKRHVLLRNFYSSDARLTPEFGQLYDILEAWNVYPTPEILTCLFDSVRATELLRESMGENQELVHPTIKGDLQEMLHKDKFYLGRMVKEILGIENPEFIDSLLQIHPKVGFGRPDTRIEPGEFLLIQ